jgi:general secretion pathway protein M
MAWKDTLRSRWAALAEREQRGLVLAALAVTLAVAWGVLVRPALRTLSAAPAQQAAVRIELERMQTMQARARALQAQPATSPQDRLRALRATAAELAPAADLQVQGELATLTLKQVPAHQLAPWLSAQALGGNSPMQANLQRDAGTAGALWSGSLVFRLPTDATGAP